MQPASQVNCVEHSRPRVEGLESRGANLRPASTSRCWIILKSWKGHPETPIAMPDERSGALALIGIVSLVSH